MTDFLTPTVTALLARLAADSGLQALLGTPARVVDQMATAPAFPYLRLVNVEQRDASLKGQGACTLMITLQSLSRSCHGDETRRIIAALRDCLHDATFAVSGATLVRCQEDLSAIHADHDVMLGTARYRVVVAV